MSKKCRMFKTAPGRYNLTGFIQSSFERLLSRMFILHKLGCFKIAIKGRKDNEMTRRFCDNLALTLF